MHWLPPLLAFLHLTAVRADALCSQATATINSQADATALASCSTISGSIVVGSTASGDISIDGPTEITGDLAVQNATELTSLSSSTIGTIGGTFTLDTLTLLSTLQFSALQTVETISWSALPNLGAITFPNGEITTSHITITNTFLSSLDGLATGVISTLDINNNPNLTSANFTITSITSSLNLAANGKATAFSFPHLHWAANITAKNCSQLNLPSISAVNGSLGLYGNSFTDFSAPTLLSVGNTATGAGSLAIISNTALTGLGLSMPLLQSIGGALQVTDNSALSTVSFPDLTNIGGAVVLTGSFSTPNLPSLAIVKGGFNLESTNTIDCSGFQKDASSGVIQGAFRCRGTGTTSTSSSSSSSSSPSSSSSSGAGSSPTNSSTSPNNNSSSGSSSGLSTGAKIGIGVAIPLAVIITALIVFAWKKGYKLSLQGPAKPSAQPVDPPHPNEAELPLGGHHEKTELPAKVKTLQKPSELSANERGPVPEAHELYSNERYEADGQP